MVIDNICVASCKSEYSVFSQQSVHISKLNLCNILFIKGTCGYVHKLILNHKINSDTCSDNIYTFNKDKIQEADDKVNTYAVSDDELRIPKLFIYNLSKYGYNNVYNHANEPYSLVIVFNDNKGEFYPAIFGFDPDTLINSLVQKYNNLFYIKRSRTKYMRSGYSYHVRNYVTNKLNVLHVKVYFNAYDNQCPLLIIVLTINNSIEDYISSVRINDDTIKNQKLINIDLCPKIWGYIQNKQHHLTDFFKKLRNKLVYINFKRTNNHDKGLVNSSNKFKKLIIKANKKGKVVHKDNLYMYWKGIRNATMSWPTYDRILDTTNINRRLLKHIKYAGFTLVRTEYINRSKSLRGILEKFDPHHRYL